VEGNFFFLPPLVPKTWIHFQFHSHSREPIASLVGEKQKMLCERQVSATVLGFRHGVSPPVAKVFDV
jgi:hypothetical protein